MKVFFFLQILESFLELANYNLKKKNGGVHVGFMLARRARHLCRSARVLVYIVAICLIMHDILFYYVGD